MGMDRFKGQLVHSALWDETVEVAGKNVAIIGIGSSGVQILPEVAKGRSRPHVLSGIFLVLTPSRG